MDTEALNYHLPKELIAQQPSPARSDSRLLIFNRRQGQLVDSIFDQIGLSLSAGDCLVLNDTKVIPARFFAHRATGGRIEGLFLSQSGESIWEVMLKNAGRVKPAEQIYLTDKQQRDYCSARVLKRSEDMRWFLKIDAQADAETVLNQIGFAPLPPYIKRSDDAEKADFDNHRYQTVFAHYPGAVAAPTAGLHFTAELIDQLKDSGVNFAYITLHVGTGTFKPVTTEKLEDHKIHRERFRIDEQNARIINTAKQAGGRIIGVGTTVVRTLETITQQGRVKPCSGSTELFIKPGHQFQAIDAMLTNFHLPKSTLLALVAAFAGLENILSAYRHAIKQRYRFYSYGDAMLIT